MADRLKKCPFCGGNAQLRATMELGCPTYSIVCELCGGRTELRTNDKEPYERWNTRTYDEVELCGSCRWFEQDGFITWCKLVHQTRDRGEYCSRWQAEEQK